MGHYKLTVDLDSLNRAKTLIGTFGEQLTEEGNKAKTLTGDRQGWKGQAATICLTEVGRIGSTMAGAAPKAPPVVASIGSLVSALTAATSTTIPSLNTRWSAADTTWAAAYEAAETQYTTDLKKQAGDGDALDPAKTRVIAQARDQRKAGADSARTTARTRLDTEHEAMMVDLRLKVRALATTMATNAAITFDDSQWAAVRGGKVSSSMLASLRSQVFDGQGLANRADLIVLAKQIDDAVRDGKDPKDALGLVDSGQLDLLVQLGLVSPTVVRDGLKDSQKVKDAIKRLELMGSTIGLGPEITATMNSLTPAEREAVLNSLSDEQLKTLYMATRFSPDPAFGSADFETASISVTSPYTVAKLAKLWNLNPELIPGGNASWKTPSGPLFADPEGVVHNLVDSNGKKISNPTVYSSGSMSADDISQGGVGDCWFIAGMKGLGQTDPDFYKGLVTQNLNGTVGVRLYDNSGKAHIVTVTNELPLDDKGGLVYARGASTAGGQETWPAYVEKAMAHTYTGGIGDKIKIDGKEYKAPPNSYLGITGDWSEAATQALTGKGTDDVGDGSFLGIGGSPQEQITNINKAIDQGKTVFVSTKGDDDTHTLLGGGVVANHLYYVDHVEPNGNIVLANPWGSADDKGRVVLTPEQFKEIQTGVTATK